jgi:hypothetical protein
MTMCEGGSPAGARRSRLGCLQNAHACGEAIPAESAVGLGTKFTVTLPPHTVASP